MKIANEQTKINSVVLFPLFNNDRQYFKITKRAFRNERSWFSDDI